jgi:hypothetical protein
LSFDFAPANGRNSAGLHCTKDLELSVEFGEPCDIGG